MKKTLLAAAIASFACSPHASEYLRDSSLPADIVKPAIVRRIDGVIAGLDKQPVIGALVSVIDQSSYRGVGFAFSDAEGRFSVGLPSTPVAVTATANGYVARAADVATRSKISIALPRESKEARRFTGSVVDTKGRPLARVRLRLMNWQWPVGTVFYTSSDEAGRFKFVVDSSGSYDLMVDDSRYVGNFTPLLYHNVENASLIAYERKRIIAQAAAANPDALRDLCKPLTVNGVRRFANFIRDASVIGLGESTHGTREFTEIRSQLVAELIRNGWLTTIALEASWGEVVPLDDYVRRDKGTARAAVGSLSYWPWRTEEFLAFVEAVHSLNHDLPDNKKIEFQGVDYSPPGAAVDLVRDYFAGTALPYATALPHLDPLRRTVSWFEPLKLSSKEREEVLRALQELTALAETDVPAALPVIQGLRITRLIVESHDPDVDFRDRVMAEAVMALLARTDKVRHVAIWAHSLHVAMGPVEGSVPMGHYLKAKLAAKYRAVGSMFYDGSFRTLSGLQQKMVNHIVAPPPDFYFENVMHRVSPSEACIISVRDAIRRPDVREWMSAPKHVRVYGGLEISESYPWPPVIIPDLWSALLFVPSTTPTTPLDEE